MQRRKAISPTGRRLVAVLGACLLILGMTACGGGGGSLENTAGDVAPVTDPTTAAEPETEDTTSTPDPEPPDPGPEDVAVTLPGLPIGGGATASTETVQCVDVGWTTPPDLPDWIGVTVSGFRFEPEGDFALSDESCESDNPPCLDGEVRISGSQRCYVAVAWTNPANDSGGELFFTAGSVSCPADRVAECNAFRDEVESAGPQPVPLEAPPFIESETTEETEPTETPEETGETEATEETPAETETSADVSGVEGGG